MEIDKKTAINIIGKGGIVALKTETVYGLAGDATNAKAVNLIFSTKKRHKKNPLIVHVGSLAMAKKYALFNELAEKIAKAFWPGPLTLLLPMRANNKIAKNVFNENKFIAIRIPKGIIGEISRQIKKPLAAPSANIANRISPSSAEIVKQQFKHKVKIVNQGKCMAGIESTILKIENNKITLMRPGALDWHFIEKFIKQKIKINKNKKIQTAGQSKIHYAPKKPIRINATTAKANEAFIAFGKQKKQIKNITVNLSKKACYIEAAKNLFYFINELDNNKLVKKIAVQKIIAKGKNKNIAIAINNRLTKMQKQ